MGTRGYILLKADSSMLKESSANDNIWELIQKLEDIDDVEFVSNTIGEYDFVISIDTQKSVEAVAEELKNTIPEWIDEVLTLTENNIFNKHRELKDLKIFENMH